MNTIDNNTLNGFGIVTIDLSNNTQIKDKTYFYDVNSDYYIYSYTINNQLIALFISCDNFKIEQSHINIQSLYGPFNNKSDAWKTLTSCEECINLDTNKYIYIENINEDTNKNIFDMGYDDINNINIYISFAYILK